MPDWSRRLITVLGGLLLLHGAAPASAQAPLRKIVELRLQILGISAGVEPANPAVPKNMPAGVRIVVRSGDRELSLTETAAVFGAGFQIEGDLTGPGLSRTLALPYTPAELDDPDDPDDTLPVNTQPLDPLILPLPGLPVSGDYTLANLRISAPGRPAFDVTPRQLTLRVIEQVLVTSVKTRQLTLDEIKEKGIVLGADDYVAFEFALGLKLESEVVDMTFPVVFNREGVALPQTITPPPAPRRRAPDLPLPTIVPVLFQVDDEGSGGGSGPAPKLPPLPGGTAPIKIPSVIVIPGNIGYLKSFFSAQLFVANGTPAGSGLVVDDVTGTIHLPPGEDQDVTSPDDNPLALPNLQRDGAVIVQPETMPVRGVGPDGEPGSADDVGALGPGEQGQAEFLLRGEREGFHTLDFDIRARLDGLATGPVRIKGKASGGVLVRNPFFDVAFTVPGVVRAGEAFTVFATLSNIGQGTAQSVFLDPATLSTSGAAFVGDPPPAIPEIPPGQSATFELDFVAQVTGQVTASYLRFEPGQAQGRLKLAVGVGPRGAPLSPDTLVLPAAVDNLPPGVVKAAMRVLGQAWSVAGAPAGTLPSDVIRTSRTVVTEKALALAEAGLRVSLGQGLTAALRDVAFDFWGPGSGNRPDPGFDQLLRESGAGRELADALGVALAEELASDPDAPADVFALEQSAAQVAASGPDFITFAVGDGGGAAPVKVELLDYSSRRTALLGEHSLPPVAEIEGATFLPLGPRDDVPVLGLVTDPASGPYRVRLVGRGSGNVQVSATFPRGDGTFARVVTPSVAVTDGEVVIVLLDPSRPFLEEENWALTDLTPQPLAATGPTLLSATVIGPETLDGASPLGFHTALVFDRVVDAESAADPSRYAVPDNGVLGAKRQLSGRLVFVNLEQPEGPYVPTTLSVTGGLTDLRGNEGPPATVDVGSLLEDPGAVVTGRVFTAEGAPVTSGVITYAGNADTKCRYLARSGFSSQELDGDGRYELRYVRRDNCGQPFWIMTTDPATGGRREVSSRVRAAGEVIELDLALLGRGAVSGTVRDVLGTAVAGANVVVVSETDPQIGGATVTDGDGVYLVDGITVGAVIVRAGKERGLGVQSGRIDRAGTVATVDVTLDGDAVRLYGTVYVEEGETSTAVPGVTVTYRHFPEGSAYGQLLGVARTDASGSYVFEEMPTGQYQISASHDGRHRDTRSGTGIYSPESPEGDRVDLHIVVPPEDDFATIEGKVFSPYGERAPDVVVTVGGRGVVSADGTYSISGVPVRGRSEQVKAASRDGRRSGTNTVVVTAAQVYAGVDITLSGLGTAAFRVLDEHGQPVGAGQGVALLGSCGNPCGCKEAVTDADGVALFPDLSLGTVTAKATRSGPSFVDVARGSVTLFENDKTAFGTLRFAGIGAVSGTVTSPDGPVHGAEVTLVSHRFDPDTCGLVRGASHRTRTPLSGEYRFEGVNLGVVGVSATHEWAGRAGAGGALVTPGQELVLDVAFEDNIAGELSGRVYLPDGVTPAGAGVEVAVQGPLPEVKVVTDGEGVYRFKKILPRGHWTLTAHDPLSSGLARSRLVLAVGQDVVHDVRLLGRGTVRVTVVDGLDQPLEAALVRLQETDYPQRSFEASLRPGDAGVVAFENVFEGPFTVDVTDAFARGGGAAGTMPAPDATVDLKVAVTKTGSVRGHFRMPDQTPIPFGTVRLLSGGRVISQATTLGAGPDVGSFAFEYVPVGTVRVEAEDPLTARRGFQIGLLEEENQELVLDVVAQGLGRVHGEVTLNGDPQGLVEVEIASGSYRAETITLADGTYSVAGVPEGQVRVTASFAGGFLAGTASDTLEGDGGAVRIDVALREAGSIVGHVYRAGGGQVPAPASLVELYVGGPGGGHQETTTRPEDGFFELSRVPVGTATLTVDVLSGIDRARETVEVGPSELVPVEIELQGVGSIGGQAVASDDPDAPGVAGWLTFTGSAFTSRRTIETGADGLFGLPEVLAGEFTVTLRQGTGPLALYGTASGVVEPGQETVVRVALQPSATVTGSVLRPATESSPQRPAFGAEVTLDVAMESGKRGTVTVQVQDEGTFEARGVPHGTLSVSVHDPVTQGRARVGPQDLDSSVLDLGTLVLDTEPPTLEFIEPADGTVRPQLGGPLVLSLADEDTGVDAATLVVTYNGTASQASASFYFDGVEASGVLLPQHLVIGENRLVARVSDAAGLVGEAETALQVTGATLSGCVLATTGGSAVGVPVALDGGEAVLTDGDGCYAFAGLRPGAHTVQATDPETGLQVEASGTMEDGVDLQLPDLPLPAAARLLGVVHHHGGVDPAEGIEVRAAGRTAFTDSEGVFDLGHLPLGTYTVDAYGPDGDRGSQPAVLDTLGVPVSVTITLNGVGAVNVIVEDGGGNAVPGARVVIQTSSGFGGTDVEYTGAGGEAALFPAVLYGTLTVQASYDGLEGEAFPFLNQPSLDVTVTLEAAGRVEGTVTRQTGGAAVGVSVELRGTKQATTVTDSAGAYGFANVPLGDFTLRLEGPAGDRGSGAGSLAAPGETVTVDVTMNGVGAAEVTVRDALGGEVEGASVTVRSQTSWGISYPGVTDSLGVVTLAGVLAGPVTVDAHLSANNTRGSATATVPLDDTVQIDVVLESLGTISGRVLAPNGVDPVSGVTVEGAGRTSVTDGAGEYVLADVKMGTYTLVAQVDGRRRARVTGVEVSDAAPDATQDLVLVWTSTVSGTVTTPSSEAAEGAAVRLHSAVSTYGGYFDATTDPAGSYTLEGVPAGAFTITATLGADRADASGSVPPTGEPVEVDLALQASAVNVPSTLKDANTMSWKVGKSGGVTQGTLWNGSTPRLSVVREGVSHEFAGPGCPSTCAVPTEEAKRELVLVQGDLGGLVATRKVYVPRDGYFVRHLDLLHNPGPEAVTVDVVEEADFRGSAFVSTSSGDGVVSAEDAWVVLDDEVDVNSFESGGGAVPPTALVALGAGGLAPSSAELVPNGSRALVTRRWDGVVVPPNGTVGFLHVITAQSTRERAEASAERLSQLPPELLAGLAPDEAGWVVNAAVPADLVSAVSPLPALDGVIQGDVFAGDAQTLVPGATVHFWSRSPHYGRPLKVTADGSGHFVAKSTPAAADPKPVPREAYDIVASKGQGAWRVTHSSPGDFASDGVIDLTSVVGRYAHASSAYGSNTAELALDDTLGTYWRSAAGDVAANGSPYLEVVLPGDATVRQIVLRGRTGGAMAIEVARVEVKDAAGAVLWSTELALSEGNGAVDVPADVAGLERARAVRVTSLLDGGYVAIAELQVFGEAEADLGPAGRATTDVVLRGSGIVRARVARSDGTPISGGEARLIGSSSWRLSLGGQSEIDFVPVPAGTYDVTSVHPLGSDSITVEGVDIPASCVGEGESLVCARVDVDLVYPTFGSLQGTVSKAGGTGYTTTTAYLEADGFSRNLRPSNTSGAYTFADVPPGDYTLTVRDHRSSAEVVHAVSIPAGSSTVQDVELWPVGTLHVTATVGGERLEGGSISWRSTTRGPSWINVGPKTSTTSAVPVTNVPGPLVSVRVTYPGVPGSFGIAEVGLDTEGQQVDVEVEVPGVGEVAGVLRSRDGTPIPGVKVSVRHATETTELGSATSDPTTGAFVIGNIPVGPVRLRGEYEEGYAYSQAEVEVELEEHAARHEHDALVALGVLDELGEWELWELTAGANENVRVLLVDSDVGTHAALADPLLEVYGPDGTLVASNDNRSGSDMNAEVSFSAPATGVYTLRARAADEGTGGYRLTSFNRNAQHMFRLYDGAAVTGTLRVGGAGEAGHAVRLVLDGRTAFSATTDSQGRFMMPVFGPGPVSATVEAPDAEGVVIARQTVAVDGNTVNVDLTAPARAAVTVRVTQVGLAVADVAVTVESDNIEALPADARRVGTTDAAGEVQTVMPVGLVRASLQHGGSTYTDEQATTGDPVSLAIALPAPAAAVYGIVSGGNDGTPVPGATAEIVGFGTALTDAAGAYRFDLVPSGSHTVRATLGSATVDVPVIQPGSDVQADLVLPLSILRGRVQETGGTGAAASVDACGYDAAWVRICVATTSAGSGAYAFYELPGWRQYTVSLTATLTDGSSLTASGQYGHQPSTHQTYVVDLLLPETGSIRGSVSGFVDPVTVHLLDGGGTTLQSQEAGAEVGFFFPRVLTGSVRVFAEDDDGIPGETTVTVEAGVEASADVWAVPTATLQLSLVDEAEAPLAGDVMLYAPETPARTGGSWTRTLSLATAATPARIPAGLFWAVFDDPDLPGAADGVLAESDDQPVTVQRGTHVRLPWTLSGTEGSYVAVEDWCEDPCSAFVSTTTWWVNEPPNLHRLGDGDRGLEGLLGSGNDVRVRREHFAPTSGRFGRSLYTVTNHGTDVVSVPLDSELLTGSYDTPELIEEALPDGDLTNDAWAAYRMGDGSLRAFVVGAALPADGAWMNEGGEGPASWGWSHTLPVAPGETRSLLAFVVSRTDGDETALLDIARGLADLAEPQALAGLTFAEREAISNFDVPPLGDIDGTVIDQGQAVAGAPVGLFDLTSTLLTETTGDEAGAFAFPAVDLGSYSLVAVESTSERPGRRAVDVVTGPPTTAEVTIADPATLGGIHVVGTEGGGAPAVGATVELWAAGYSPVWAPTAVLDTNGEATFTGVPPGSVEVRWVAPHSGDPATVGVSAGQTETAALTAAAPPVFPPVDLNGADGIPYTVDSLAQVSLDQGCQPFCGTLAAFEDDLGDLWDEYPDFTSGTSLHAGRGVALGPHTLSIADLETTRRVFAPTSGRFARILDIIHNPGPSDVSLSLYLDLDLESAVSGFALQTSSGDAFFDTEDQYGVFTAGATRVVGFVTSGAGADHPPDELDGGVSDKWGWVYTTWYGLNVPAGGSVIVMQFVVAREAGDTTGAEAQAAALADLTDPEALAGLSAAERALIVNFEAQ